MGSCREPMYTGGLRNTIMNAYNTMFIDCKDNCDLTDLVVDTNA